MPALDLPSLVTTDGLAQLPAPAVASDADASDEDTQLGGDDDGAASAVTQMGCDALHTAWQEQEVRVRESMA